MRFLLLLATAIEAPPFQIPQEAAQLPAQATFDLSALPLWLQVTLPALGLFMTSLGASFWSDYVRRLGPKAKPWMLSLSAALNVAAGNPHKAARAAKAAKGVQP